MSRPTAREILLVFLWCFSICFFSFSDCFDIRIWGVDTTVLCSHTQMRRRLGRVGSYPPRCVGKCRGCNPCRAVHVRVPPGAAPVLIAQYYPEAWRCKCGNRLFIP